jgi:hypothetical protein
MIKVRGARHGAQIGTLQQAFYGCHRLGIRQGRVLLVPDTPFLHLGSVLSLGLIFPFFLFPFSWFGSEGEYPNTHVPLVLDTTEYIWQRFSFNFVLPSDSQVPYTIPALVPNETRRHVCSN